ncbi:uncharacterized protein B0I36DRAFT_314398 [Microdochium trichocladiopsis]|uniref:Uncharacterized protein n=1 Tax=Microdochium trichocladiopsis TaxID=1682393 RepID=A0A9P8YE04_9PEZI|nr:uncharacterized protein B0I36DRAFT_314398 [Microdochium trichocladiopsis]KAH7037593.1 hypothetical protein B0I36DRAFT_314398 [Microdochium trichocladiopsis]
MLFPLLVLVFNLGPRLVDGAARASMGPRASTTYAAQNLVRVDTPMITTPPSLEDLQKRDLVYQGNFLYAPDHVCGYVSGDPCKKSLCISPLSC